MKLPSSDSVCHYILISIVYTAAFQPVVIHNMAGGT